MNREYLTFWLCKKFIEIKVWRRKEGFVVAKVSSGRTCGGGFFPTSESVYKFMHSDHGLCWRDATLETREKLVEKRIIVVWRVASKS